MRAALSQLNSAQTTVYVLHHMIYTQGNTNNNTHVCTRLTYPVQPFCQLVILR